MEESDDKEDRDGEEMREASPFSFGSLFRLHGGVRRPRLIWKLDALLFNHHQQLVVGSMPMRAFRVVGSTLGFSEKRS